MISGLLIAALWGLGMFAMAQLPDCPADGPCIAGRTLPEIQVVYHTDGMPLECWRAGADNACAILEGDTCHIYSEGEITDANLIHHELKHCAGVHHL